MRLAWSLPALLSLATPVWAQSAALITAEIASVERIVGGPLTHDERARVIEAAHQAYDSDPARSNADEPAALKAMNDVMTADPYALAMERERIEQLDDTHAGDRLLTSILDAHDPVLAVAGGVRLSRRAVDGFLDACAVAADMLGQPAPTPSQRAALQRELLDRFAKADDASRLNLAQSTSTAMLMRQQRTNFDADNLARFRSAQGPVDTPALLAQVTVSLMISARAIPAPPPP